MPLELLNEQTERIIEIANALLAVVTSILALSLAKTMKGGALEKTWKLLSVSLLGFMLIELFDLIRGFGILSVGGLHELLELFTAVSFTFAMRTAWKALRV